MDIISNCPLCEAHSLHLVGEKESQMMQCISCGYVSTDKFIGTKEDNEEYNKLSDEMKGWAKESEGRIWIPSIMTLPFGMIYPFNQDDTMKWSYAKMVQIAEDDKKDYPIPGQENKFYDNMYDTENIEVVESFLVALAKANEDAKKANVEPDKITLPKLKKVDFVKT